MQGKKQKLYAAGRKKEYKENIFHELQERYSRNEVQKLYKGVILREGFNQGSQYVGIR
jgi:hypothetical protein